MSKAGYNRSDDCSFFEVTIPVHPVFSKGEFKEWCFDRQTKLVENIDPENDKELLEQAFNFYADLVVKKRELERIQQST